MLIEKNFKLNAAPSIVWPYLIDASLQKKWITGLVENRLLDAHQQVGSKFVMRVREGNKIAQYEGEILVFEKHREFSMMFSGGNFKMGTKMFVDYRLSDVDALETNLYYRSKMEIEEPSILFTLCMPLMRAFSIIQIKSFMRKLKIMVEKDQHKVSQHA